MQPFGKRKSHLSVPRPKKAKVPVARPQRSEQILASTGSTAKEEASASTLVEQGGGPGESSDEDEDPALRKQADQLVKWARAAKVAAAVDVRKAEAELRHEQRRQEERMQRWDAAERRSEPPPAYLQLERVYKSQVKGLQARLKLSEAQKAAAEANAELSDALLLKAEYLHACSSV